MRMIEGIPQVVTGIAYYPHITVPVPNYGKTANGYEINLAVGGISSVMLNLNSKALF